MSAVYDRSLADDDLYPLLVRIWTGTYAAIDWPPQAPQIARRCAQALAAERPCEHGVLNAPTERSVQTARDAVVADLQPTPRDLLAVLADNWRDVEHLEGPLDQQCTLLEFAAHVLIEPVAAACALMWPGLHHTRVASEARRRPEPNRWSPVAGDDWSDVVRRELVVLRQPNQDVPEDGDDAALLLAWARANVIMCGGEPAVSPRASCGPCAPAARRT